MPPTQYDNVMASLAQLREEIRNLNKALHDHASLEAEDREILEERLRHALYGGNGDGEGLYERMRKFLGWKAEHIQTHQRLTVERRSVDEDWRRFFLDTAKQVIAVVIAVLAVIIIWSVTGKVVTFP